MPKPLFREWHGNKPVEGRKLSSEHLLRLYGETHAGVLDLTGGSFLELLPDHNGGTI